MNIVFELLLTYQVILHPDTGRGYSAQSPRLSSCSPKANLSVKESRLSFQIVQGRAITDF